MLRADRTRFAPLACILLALAVAHVALARATWRDIPIQTDVGIWSYIGARLVDGRSLYTDLWDSKPPGIYWLFAACARLGGPANDRPALWLDAAVSLALLAVTWRLARRFASAAPAAMAVLAASFVCCHRVLADWGCNVEKFVALFEALALLSALRAIEKRSAAAWLRAGLFAGLAGCFKQTAILFPIASIIFLVAAPPAGPRPARLRAIAALALGAAIVWLPVLAWLYHRGELAGFWKLAVRYDLQRATPGSEASRITSPDHWLDLARQLRLACILLLPALCGAIIVLRRRPSAAPAPPAGIGLLLTLAAIESLTFALAPYGYGHYLLQLIPAASALAAVAFQFAFFDAPPPHPRARLLAAAALVVAAIPLFDHFHFTLSRNHPARIAYDYQRANINAWTQRIRAETNPTDAVLIWPPDYPLSFYAARRTPLELSNADVLFQRKSYRLDPPFDAILAHIRSDPPAMIIDRTHLKAEPLPNGGVEITVPDNEISLYPDLNATPPRQQVTLTTPFLEWVRANYGGQSRGPDGIALIPHQPWRPLPDLLQSP